ncbi:MAG: phage holin family protein [Trebonia sp.]
MARSGTADTGTPDGTRDQQSLGDLVSLALKDLSQLVRYEITLATKEFKIDLRRAAFGAAFGGLVLMVAYPLLMMLLFAYAYGLYAVGVPGGLWGAFLWVALTVFVVALIAAGIGFVFFKKVTGMQLTRKTVSDDIGMLKRAGSSPDGATPAVGSADRDKPGVTEGSSGDGVTASISARP